MAYRFRLIHVLYIICFLSLLAIFSFRLNYTALQSYDEAWYGDIVRNLVASKNPFKLVFNQATFRDHPPGGFVVMSIPVLLFRSSEFSIRITSVVAGALTVMLLIGIGRRLNGSIVGVSAALILVSCLWFMLRVRTGNLDALFLFWETLTVYTLLRSEKKMMYLAAVAFAMLLVTKTLVGVGLLPAMVFLVWQQREAYSFQTWLKAVGIIGIIILPWYIVQITQDSTFLRHHFLTIGTRGESNNFTLSAVKENLSYIAIGVGKWYKPWILSVILGFFHFVFVKKNRWQLAFLFWWGVGFAPFLISSQTEIWHLLPLYPVIALSIPLVGMAYINKWFVPWPIITLCFGCLICLLAVFQWRQFSNLIYEAKPTFSAEKDISIKAKGQKNVYLLGTFYPAAVYYSETKIDPLYLHPEAYLALKEILSASDAASVIIDRDTSKRLETDGVEYHVLDENESYLLVAK